MAWNSWYNPLDNIANVAKTAGSAAYSAVGGAVNTPGSPVNLPGVDTGRSGPLNLGPVGNAIVNSQAGQGGAPAANTGGGGGGQQQGPAAPTPAPVDPYARWGGQAAFNAKRNTYGASQNSYKAGAQTTLRDVGNTYNDKTNSFVNEIDTGQGDINRGLSTNELNLRRSMQNIVRGIQTGVRSGGVALAGMNAADSGAADALARAYAKVGNTQTGEARGQAATAAEELQRSQGQLNLKRGQGEEALNTFRDTETGRVRGDFGSKLDMLAADAEGNGFGGVIEKSLVDQVLGEALARLATIDQSRQQRLSGVRQWTPEEIMAEAIRMDEAGQAGNAFQVTGPDVSYGGGVPINGAPLGQMPIYTKGREDQQVTIPGRREEVLA